MNLFNWVRGRTTRASSTNGGDISDAKFHRAMELADEVTTKMRERAASPDPFRALMADLFLQHHDIALVADAFEAAQEANIYKGNLK